MGMRMSGASASVSAMGASSTQWQHNKQNMKALFSDLKSGNLDAAKKDFAALSSNGKTIDPNSPLGQIGTALSQGNLAQAQQVAQSMHQHHTSSATSGSTSAGSSMASSATPNTNPLNALLSSGASSLSMLKGLGNEVDTLA